MHSRQLSDQLAIEWANKYDQDRRSNTSHICRNSGIAAPDDAITLGIGPLLAGLGWSFTLIAGSAFLTESVAPEVKTSAQGASDLVMNLIWRRRGSVGWSNYRNTSLMAGSVFSQLFRYHF